MKILNKDVKQTIYLMSVVMLFPLPANASFIETTIGTAVVNDATASYFNPAALVQIKNPQIIPQVSLASFHARFTGQSTVLPAGITEAGSTSTNTQFYSPSLYFGMPTTNRIMLGFAIVTNSANRSTDENSILRYAQASNNIQDYDVTPALAIKINEYFSIGAGISFSYAHFQLRPVTGFPGSNVSDRQSNNQSDGSAVGGNVGLLLKPGPTTVLGFNYRLMETYQLSGASVYEGTPAIVSNNYHYKLSTPARGVFSMNHFVTKKLGFITTVQRIFWGSMPTVYVYGIASPLGTINGVSPNYLRDTWLLTLGSHYRISPKWIVRVAGTYNQSPENPHREITNGDSITLGVSTGYEINKTVTVDAGYAHGFMKDANINVTGNRYSISGVNEGSRDSVSMRLIFNL